MSANATARRVRKKCRHIDCSKIDAGGGFCVAHGGGKKCAFPGCRKGYQTGGFCRKHGGGARCHVPGCGKVDAGKGLCRAHGGGKRCQAPECKKADVGGGFCTAHGGGKRCSEPGCTKIDQGGGKCRAHGGTKRCREPGCTQTARGAEGFCTDHGGARICALPHCRRLARNNDGTLCATCAAETHSENKNNNIHRKKQMHMTSPTARSTRSSSNNRVLTIETKTSQTVILNGLTSDEKINLTPKTMRDFPASSVNANGQTQKSFPKRCDGSHIASCLENGCSRSFGGDCNCTTTCQCFCSESTSSNESLTEDLSAAISMKRYLLQLENDGGLEISAILALLATITDVRSVHDASVGRAEKHGGCLCMVTVRGEPTLEVTTVTAFLEKFNLRSHLIEQTDIYWTRKEVVIRVPEMMCPGNCGKTVMNAIRTVNHVDTANLVFEKRQVVVRGSMSTAQLCSAVTGVGFECEIDAVTPVPSCFRFRVNELVDIHFCGSELTTVLKTVEGVESIVVVIERAEVLVVAMLFDASPLLQTASHHGFVMVEIPENNSASDINLQNVSGTHGSATSNTIISHAGFVANHTSHDCDIKICPHNGCPQYIATVAHTAALAVGWSVPGCAMTWGGECTCGENCKCAGCPEHNPSA